MSMPALSDYRRLVDPKRAWQGSPSTLAQDNALLRALPASDSPAAWKDYVNEGGLAEAVRDWICWILTAAVTVAL